MEAFIACIAIKVVQDRPRKPSVIILPSMKHENPPNNEVFPLHHQRPGQILLNIAILEVPSFCHKL